MAKATRFTSEMIKENLSKGYWNTDTLSGLWEKNASRWPDKDSLIDSRFRLTWAQAKEQIDRIALKLMQLGFKKDDVIIIQLPNWIEFYTFSAACEKAGIISVLAQRNLRHSEMEYVLSRMNASGIVIPRKFRNFDHYKMIQEIRPVLSELKYIFIAGEGAPEETIAINDILQQPVPEIFPRKYFETARLSPFEVSVIKLTSGTTGMPKLVESPACQDLCLAKTFIERRKISCDSVIGIILPATAGPSFVSYYMALKMGARLVLLEGFDADEALGLIEKEKITYAAVAPPQLAKMLESPEFGKHNYGSLICFHCSTGPLTYEVARLVEERMGTKVLNSLGGQDVGSICSTSLNDTQEVRLRTVGKPNIGVEVRLVDESGSDIPAGSVGELIVRSASSPSGYYKDAKATWQVWDNDGWYHTRDLGKWDEGGNLVMVGRKDSVIIRGGQNIYPAEIESLLLTHPDVSSAAIVSMPDRIMGEKACACVVPKQGATFTFDEMLSFLRSKKIAIYKLPERLEIVHELPLLGDTFKVDRQSLVEDIKHKLSEEENIDPVSS